ncbi:MAG TPA: DNA topoisomerase, partial [bacterium]|nr:DNA topoisomerase [bacterium]
VSVEDIKKSEKADTPSPPFITSSLQQEAIKKYGFSAQRVMQIAQHLYEGVETPGGILGLITYHRTDSVNVAEQAQKKARVYIKETFGDGALPPKSPQYKTKSRLAQEAHEAIRPTDVFNAPEKVQEYLKPDELKVYQLIWMRFLSSQMKKGVWEHLSVVLKTREYLFQLKARRIGEKGYLVLYPEKLNEEENNYEILKSLSKGSRLPIEKVTINSHETKPPARYTEASLIKEMEELGIGRPSTFAPTVGILFKRGYVRKERGSLFPQELGKRVKDMLEEYFHPILDLKFTARLEEDLDLIAQGQKKRLDILKDFYSWFSRELIEAQKKITSQKQQSTDEKCPGCGASLFMGFNRFGKYLYCKNCRKKILFDKNGVKVEGEIKECALCHSPMRLVLGRRGFFYSCTAFPRCRYTESYKK